MIAGRLILLLIGPFVLLIDDDKPQIGLGSKDSPPRPDDHIEGTLPYQMPLVELLAQGELAMKDGHPVGKTGGETINGLGSKGDLGHEHYASLAPRDGFS
jgi:hypothetical protein